MDSGFVYIFIGSYWKDSENWLTEEKNSDILNAS